VKLVVWPRTEASCGTASHWAVGSASLLSSFQRVDEAIGKRAIGIKRRELFIPAIQSVAFPWPQLA
jgi:hypothetical protein